MIDEKDKVILSHLERNARTPFTKIAKDLNISEAAIRKRVKKLEDEHVILNYSANINHKKLGYSNKVIMGVDCLSNQYFKVIDSLKKINEIKNLTTSSGDHMIMFEVWVKNMVDLEDILNRINAIDGVQQTCPSIIHEEIQNSK